MNSGDSIQPQLDAIADSWRQTGYNYALEDFANAARIHQADGGKIDGRFVIRLLKHLNENSAGYASRRT